MPIAGVQTIYFSHSSFSFKMISFSPKLALSCLCYPPCDGFCPVGSFLSPCRVPLCWGIWGQRHEQGREEVWGFGLGGFLLCKQHFRFCSLRHLTEKADRGGDREGVKDKEWGMLLQEVVMRAHFIAVNCGGMSGKQVRQTAVLPHDEKKGRTIKQT